MNTIAEREKIYQPKPKKCFITGTNKVRFSYKGFTIVYSRHKNAAPADSGQRDKLQAAFDK